MKTEIRNIAPALAAELLSRNNQNRPLKTGLVGFYAEEMRAGRWQDNGESIVVARNGQLLDGQHRLSAVVASGTTQQFVVVSDVDPQAFATIDTGITRTTSDVLAIKGFANATNTTALARKIIAYQNGGATQANKSKLSGGHKLHLSTLNVLEFCQAHDLTPHLHFANVCAPTKGPSLVSFSDVAFFHWLFGQKSVVDAEEFWLGVYLKVSDYYEHDPRLMLNRRLNQNKASRLTWSRAVLFNAIVRCWNAYRQRRGLQVLYANQQADAIL